MDTKKFGQLSFDKQHSFGCRVIVPCLDSVFYLFLLLFSMDNRAQGPFTRQIIGRRTALSLSQDSGRSYLEVAPCHATPSDDQNNLPRKYDPFRMTQKTFFSSWDKLILDKIIDHSFCCVGEQAGGQVGLTLYKAAKKPKS
jgi:hypothetical protein